MYLYRLDGKQDEVDCATVSTTGSGEGSVTANQAVPNSGIILAYQ